jgi:flagellar secretion chaperone FliS
MEKSGVNAHAGKSRVAAYHSVSVHGGVSEAKPHALVLMLLNAAKERMARARGCIERRETAHKARLLHSCVTIIAELRGSLNMAEGQAVAQNLSDLYDYMMRRLLLANAEDNVAAITEVEHLLGEIRTAWDAIEPQVRQSARPAVAAAQSQ